MLLPGEGHTIVGHDGRISSTQAIVRMAPEVDVMTEPDGARARVAVRVPARTARRGGRSGRPGATRLHRHRRRAGHGRDRRRPGRDPPARQHPQGRGHHLHRRGRRRTAGATISAGSDSPIAVGGGLGGDRRRVAAADQGAERLPERRLRRTPASSGTASSRSRSSRTARVSCLRHAIWHPAGGRAPSCWDSICCTHRPVGGSCWRTTFGCRPDSGMRSPIGEPPRPRCRCCIPGPVCARRNRSARRCCPRCRRLGRRAAGVRRRRLPCSPTVPATRPGTSIDCWPTRWACRWSRPQDLRGDADGSQRGRRRPLAAAGRALPQTRRRRDDRRPCRVRVGECVAAGRFPGRHGVGGEHPGQWRCRRQGDLCLRPHDDRATTWARIR